MRVMVEAPHTISEIFAATVARRGTEPALAQICEGEVRWRSWQELAIDAERLAARVRAAGVARGDRVAQVSENRYEWIITDLALHLVGAVHVPIHVTLSGEQIAEQIADCGARLVYASSKDLLAKFVNLLKEGIPTYVHDDHEDRSRKQLSDGPSVGPAAKTQAAPGDLATILYTSGTTGRPRGVMLSQRNLASNAVATADAFGTGVEQTRLCILPLSHIYARTCDLYTWVYKGSRLVIAESRDTLLRDCQLAKPTALNAVPYLYGRIADRVSSSGAADAAAALRSAFGGSIERLSSGGAPLAPEVERWYAEQGLPILCGYGLTESSPVIAASTPEAHRIGRVGRAISGIEVRIAEDGEILTRGPHVMLGYWRDEAATAEVIREGWLHTGDLGDLDADGFLAVHGRKKEMIVLSTGKKVIPTRVEYLLSASPLIEQAAVFGDGECSVVALIVPAANASDDVRSMDAQYAEEIRRCLTSAAHEEQIWHFKLIDRPFSIERGELTAKLSLCRSVIAENFAKELDELRLAVERGKAARRAGTAVTAG